MAQAISGEARYGNQVYPINNLTMFGRDPNDAEKIRAGFAQYNLLKRGLDVVRTERAEVRLPSGRVFPAGIVWHNGDWSAVVEFAA